MNGSGDPDPNNPTPDPPPDEPPIDLHNQSVSHPYEPGKNDKDEEPSEKRNRERLQVLINIVLAVVGICAIVIYGEQLGEMRKQTADVDQSTIFSYHAVLNAGQQAGITRKQFVANQRPWIALDSSDKNPISFYAPLKIATRRELIVSSDTIFTNRDIIRSDESELGDNVIYAMFDLSYRIKNFGHSPARVYIDAKVINDRHGFLREQRLARAVDLMCSDSSREHYESKKFFWPCTLPPGDMRFNRGAFPLRVNLGESLNPTIIGCIWYQNTTGDDTHTVHVTPFSAQISSATDDKGRHPVDMRPLPIPVRSVPSDIQINNMRVVDVLTHGNAD
jgi:hypothetical protein